MTAPNPITIAARAIMIEDGCGLTIDGERVFCDDPRGSDPAYECKCKNMGHAVIVALKADGRLLGKLRQVERVPFVIEDD